MTEYRKGDRVRVTYGAVILSQWNGPNTINGFTMYEIQAEDGTQYAVPEHVLMLIERAAPKVGDELTGAECDQLPRGTRIVLLRSSTRAAYTSGGRNRIGSGWLSDTGHAIGLLPSSRYRVVYIPEQS